MTKFDDIESEVLVIEETIVRFGRCCTRELGKKMTKRFIKLNILKPSLFQIEFKKGKTPKPMWVSHPLGFNWVQPKFRLQNAKSNLIFVKSFKFEIGDKMI